MLKKDTIVAGTIVLTFAGIISRVLGFLYRIFLSNLIGAEGLGIFQMIFPVLSFCVALSCGGIQTAVSRFVAESKNKKNGTSILFASLIMSSFLAIITALVLYYIAEPVSISILHNASCETLLKYASYTIPLAAFHACVTGYYLGLKKPFVPACVQILEQFVKVISLIIIGTVMVGNNITITPLIAVYSLILSEVGGAIFCFITLTAGNMSSLSSSIKNINLFANIKMLFSVSYILTINKIMLSFLQSVEAILIPFALMNYGMSNSGALSLYGILAGMALPVITFPSAISSSVAMMVMPEIARANTSGSYKKLKYTTNMTVWFSIVSGIFCIGMFIFYGDFIGREIFGHNEAGKYIQTLAWLCPFMYMSISFGSILHGLGKTTIAFVHNAIEIIIRLAFLWFLVPVFGIKAYLYGLLLSELLTAFLHGHYIYKQIPFSISPLNNIIKPTAWLIISLAMGKLVIYILSHFFNSALSLTSIIIKGLGALVICIVFFYFAYRQWKLLRTA